MSEFDAYLIDRVNIFRQTETPDRFGGNEIGEEKIGIDVPCRIYSMKTSLRVEIDGRSFLSMKRMMVMPDVSVKVGDRVVTQDESYIITKVDRKRDEKRTHHITCDLSTILSKDA